MKKVIIWSLIVVIFALNSAKEASAQTKDKKTLLGKTAQIAGEVIKRPFKVAGAMLGFDLGKLIITPTKYEKFIKDITVSASVIDNEDFKKGSFYDVSETLNRVNSVRIERFGSYGQAASPVIRGMTGSRVLVLIDGIPYNSPSVGQADISKIPLSKVERIEIVRGPYSSLYGADAVGGVINIITKDVPKETTVKTAYSFGSWNTHNISVENGSTYGKLGYNVLCDYLFTDGARTHSDHKAFDATSKLKLNILDDVIYTLYTNYYVAKTEQPGARPGLLIADRTPTEVMLGNEDISSLYDHGRTQRVHLNSTLDIKNFSANHYFLYWNDDSHRETISFLNNRDRLIDNDEYMTYVYGMEYKYVQPIMDIDTVTLGASFKRKVFKVKTHQFNENTIAHTFGGRDDVRREWSIYGENEFKLYPFTVICGLRYDDPSDYKTRWSPKISGMLDLGFGTKVRTSYAKAYRAPTLNDINWPQDAYAEGNPNLNPEKTESWEIGVEKLFKDLLLLRATYFRQKVMDAIVWAPTGTRVALPWFSYARWTPSNLNKLSTKGVELEARVNVLKELLLKLDYTYLDPVEVSTAQSNPINDRILTEYRRPAAYIPRHKFYGALEWQKPFGIEGLKLDTFLTFVSHRRNYYAEYAANFIDYIDYPKKVLAHYFLWDFKASYEHKGVEFFFAIDNILNRGYSKFGNKMQDRDYPQPGISFTGGASAKY
ncbi:MAG: TonB-dependent receptor [Candidatus Omnitrophica bacterium]|nr:TonB-dependent receptor [Candidatus Omnitrophota bacterium]